MSLVKRFSAGCVFVVAAATPCISSAVFIEREVGGTSDPNSILATVNLFRADVGAPDNLNAAGPLFGGRREINWDGGNPANVATTQNGTPFGAFLNRGALITTPGSGVVQAPPSGLATVFSNATYTTTFSTFSPSRLFTPVDSNTIDITFLLPSGTANVSSGIPATVSGFGAVFSDVDLVNSASMTFFDANGNVIFNDSSITPGTGAASLSFAGAFDPAAGIARVRIVSGTAAPGPNDAGSVDIVVLDDFIFAEPRRIPEPAPLATLLLALVPLLSRRRKA